MTILHHTPPRTDEQFEGDLARAKSHREYTFAGAEQKQRDHLSVITGSGLSIADAKALMGMSDASLLAMIGKYAPIATTDLQRALVGAARAEAVIRGLA